LVPGETDHGWNRELTDVDAALADIGERLVSGQPEALEECYRTLGPLVVSYLGRYVPRSDVEDVLQRVFYEVWRAHDRYDPAQPLRGWVLGIARKRAIDHLRKRRDTVVPLDSVREITGDDGREIADRLAWADEVRSALSQLPDMQREVIELAYFEGYSQSEIAAALDIPLGTVKTRTSRGLQRLASYLQTLREGSL
jgi:RNA polymerase sigma-70 factor (ECF subfamily)